MRYKPLLPLGAVLALGILGSLVRGWELSFAFDLETGLYSAGAMAFTLPAITLFAVLLIALTAALHRPDVADYLSAFPIRSRGALAFSALAGFILIAAGVLKIFAFVQNVSFSSLFYGILTVVCGVSFLMLSKARFRGEKTDAVVFVSTIPIYWACFLLILTFMEHPVEPVIPTFAYDLLASCAILLSIYYSGAMLYGKKPAGMCLFSALCALYLMIVTAGGRVVSYLWTHETHYLLDAPFRMAVYAACFLYLLFCAASLLRAPAAARRKN